MSNNLLGGRGPCEFCHEWHNNVAFHSEWECEQNPRGYLARERKESHQKELLALYESAFGKIQPAKKLPTPIQNELQRSFEETFGTCQCEYTADGSSCTKCGRSVVELPRKIQSKPLFKKPTEPELDNEYYKNLDEFERYFAPKPIQKTPHPAIHEELTATAKEYTGLQITCSGCQTKITKPAALLFSPPRKQGKHDVAQKYHLCNDCFEIACVITGINQ